MFRYSDIDIPDKDRKRAFGQRSKVVGGLSVGDRAALSINRLDTSANSQCASA